MSFLTGPNPPVTDLEIVLDFLFEAIEGWSAQFRTQEINRKMYEAGQAFTRIKAASISRAAGSDHGSERGLVEDRGSDGEEEAAEEREADSVRSLKDEADPKAAAARERMAKARAVRARNLALKKSAGGSPS